MGGNGIHGELLRELYNKGKFWEGMASTQYKDNVMSSAVQFYYRNSNGQTPTPSAQLKNANPWLDNFVSDGAAAGARGGAGAATCGGAGAAAEAGVGDRVGRSGTS